MNDPSNGEASGRRWGLGTCAIFVFALVAACAGLGLLASSMLGPGPARSVTFSVDWDADPTCHGPTYQAGDVAYTACDGAYRLRALVRLDPLAATATALHRWEIDDGNTPRIHFVRRCGDDLLFVIAETRGAHLVRLAGDDVTATHDVELDDWFDLLGVSCDEESVHLFTRESDGDYAIRAVSGDAAEVERAITQAEVPGFVSSAWPTEAGWSLLIRGPQNTALIGPLGGSFVALDTGFEGNACVLDEVSGQATCLGPSALVRFDSEPRVVELPPGFDQSSLVLREGSIGVGFSHRDDRSAAVEFAGIGPLGFSWREENGTLAAWRGSSERIGVISSPRGFRISARALPLSGDRVAVWGRLGNQVVVLGPDLQREDPLGPLARIVRAFDAPIYVSLSLGAILLFTMLWLLSAAAFFARRAGVGAESRLRLGCLVYLAVWVVFGGGFVEALGRI